MGFNSALIILNDGLSDIKEDKEFGKKVHDSILRLGIHGIDYVDIGSGSHCNCASVIACNHADEVSVIAVGGNYGSVIGKVWNGNKGHHKDEDKIRILKTLADDLGYRLEKI
jgi:hypothetical protein